MVVASLIYLHPAFPSLPKGPVAPPKPSPSLVSNQYSALYDVVTANTGWALVVGPDSGPSPSYVFRTTDGAKHWNVQLTAYSAQPRHRQRSSSLTANVAWSRSGARASCIEPATPELIGTRSRCRLTRRMRSPSATRRTAGCLPQNQTQRQRAISSPRPTVEAPGPSWRGQKGSRGQPTVESAACSSGGRARAGLEQVLPNPRFTRLSTAAPSWQPQRSPADPSSES